MYKKSLKQIHQRNIHFSIKQPPSQSEGKRPLEVFREFIGLIATGTGIFAAILYLAGRSFASGYFAAMNIPSYQVNFSLWEYGEVAWFPMILYPTLLLGGGGLFWTAIFAIGDIVAPLLRRLFDWFKSFSKTKTRTSPYVVFSQQTRQWFALVLIAFLILILSVIVDTTLYFVRNWGELSGQINVLQNSAQIDLTSTDSLALENTQASSQSYYQYKNYQLLTFNGDKYFIFKEIDPVTCKPSQVYVVDSKNLIQLNIREAKSLEDKCSKKLPKGFISTLKTLFSK